MNSENSEKTRPKRNSKGQFIPGNQDSVGNNGGRPPIIRPVRELARQHTEDAIRMLAEIAANPDMHGSARVAAIKEILDRGEGKVTQPIETTGDLCIRWMKPDEAP